MNHQHGVLVELATRQAIPGKREFMVLGKDRHTLRCLPFGEGLGQHVGPGGKLGVCLGEVDVEGHHCAADRVRSYSGMSWGKVAESVMNRTRSPRYTSYP